MVLRKLLEPIMLQRKKANVEFIRSSEVPTQPAVDMNGDDVQASGSSPSMSSDDGDEEPLARSVSSTSSLHRSTSERGNEFDVKPKHELVLWLDLSEAQRRVYQGFLESDEVRTHSSIAVVLLLT